MNKKSLIERTKEGKERILKEELPKIKKLAERDKKEILKGLKKNEADIATVDLEGLDTQLDADHKRDIHAA